MKRRHFFTGLAVAIWLLSFWAVVAQQREVSRLRGEQRRLLAKLDSDNAGPGTSAQSGSAVDSAEARTSSSSPELLQLRNEVTTLTQRRRALEGVTEENERLRAQLASSQNNSAGFVQGYIRKTQAKLVGYATPEATMQSFLWAVQNRDVATMLRAVTPESAQQLQNMMRDSNQAEDMFRGMAAFVGMGEVSRTPQPDGSLELSVQILPNLPPQPVRFRQVGGEWKMDFPR